MPVFRTLRAAGIDGLRWWRLCTSFHAAAEELCAAILLCLLGNCKPWTIVCYRIFLWISFSLSPYYFGQVSRSILVGVCKVVKHVVAPTTVYVIRGDIQSLIKKIAGLKAAVHAVRLIFDHDDSDAILLIDATNGFNLLKSFSCPSTTVLTNSPCSY